MSEVRRIGKFLASGGAAAAVNVGSRWLLSHVLVYEAAVTLAYLIGMTCAFLLARRFVFTAGERSWHAAYGRFAAVNAVSFLIVLGVSVGLARGVLPWIGWRWHAEELAHVVGVLSPVALSYYAHKHFTFGSDAPAAETLR